MNLLVDGFHDQMVQKEIMKLFESESKKPQINLTSLIDILFLLIIFFAVTTQFSQQKAIGINLPQKVKTASKIYTTKNLILSMKNSNEIFLNGKKFVWSNLGKEIQQKRYDRKQKVVLNIDQREVARAVRDEVKGGFALG